MRRSEIEASLERRRAIELDQQIVFADPKITRLSQKLAGAANSEGRYSKIKVYGRMSRGKEGKGSSIVTAGKDLVNIGNLIHDLICANANLILAVVAPFGLAGGWTLDYANTLCY